MPSQVRKPFVRAWWWLQLCSATRHDWRNTILKIFQNCEILPIYKIASSVGEKSSNLFLVTALFITCRCGLTANIPINLPVGNGCGSVGRAVASATRGPQFTSSHWQTFFIEHLFTLNCIEKAEIKKKSPGNGHLKNINILTSQPSL